LCRLTIVNRWSCVFNQLFSTVTGYAALDQRIVKTRADKGGGADGAAAGKAWDTFRFSWEST